MLEQIMEAVMMERYGAYIWTVVSLTAVVLIANAWIAQNRLRSALYNVESEAEKSAVVSKPKVIDRT